MRLNNFLLLAILFFAILGIQSFSNCNPQPPPDPGLIDIQITTLDTNNQSFPNTLIGLFATSELRDTRYAPYGLGCIIDTFYTDANGYKKISYVSGKYNYYWVAVIPNNHTAASASVQKHSLDTTFIIKPVLPLLSVNIKKLYYDSVIVQTMDLPSNYCKHPVANLVNIPLTLNWEIITSDSHFLFNVAPNQRTNIRVLNYSEGKIVTDSIVQVSLGETILEVQIN